MYHIDIFILLLKGTISYEEYSKSLFTCAQLWNIF